MGAVGRDTRPDVFTCEVFIRSCHPHRRTGGGDPGETLLAAGGHILRSCGVTGHFSTRMPELTPGWSSSLPLPTLLWQRRPCGEREPRVVGVGTHGNLSGSILLSGQSR